MTNKQITFADARFVYYDIESLKDVFSMATYDTRSNQVEIFYLLEPGSKLESEINQMSENELNHAIITAIAKYNPAYQDEPGRPDFANGAPRPRWARIYDLKKPESFIRMARLIGVNDADSVNNPYDTGTLGNAFRPTCDTDPNYDPFNAHPYLCGYNSYNYDTTMLALFFMEVLSHPKMVRAVRELNASTIIDHIEGWTEFTNKNALAQFSELYDPPTPSLMRTQHNDALFSGEFKEFGMASYLSSPSLGTNDKFNSFPNRLRRAMLHSGRHIDIARFNEAQAKVALKRLLGGQGRQILESEKLSSHDARINNVEELVNLLGYNVSDVIGLSKLAANRTYSAPFDLKVGLLNQYPETIYNRSPEAYAPRIAPDNVRRNRLTPDSTSARFVGLILSPYGKLTDFPEVTFMYPHPTIAKQMRDKGKNVESTNVLKLCEDFFEAQMGPFDTDKKRQAKLKFDNVIAYYRSIEGQNFNDSVEYTQKYDNRSAKLLSAIPKRPNNLPYFDKDGNATTGFATFSTGGIHGAEYHKDAYENAKREYLIQEEMLELVKSLYPDPKEYIRLAKAEHNRVYLNESRTNFVDKSLVIYTRNGKAQFRPVRKNNPIQNEQLARAKASGLSPQEILATQRDAKEMLNLTLPGGDTIIGKVVLKNTTEKNAEYRDVPSFKKPLLFKPKKNKDGSTILESRFAYTSVGTMIHEDFSSYYPNLLRNLNAFYNADLGEDRYAKILADKDRYQELAKNARNNNDEEAARRFDTLRNGTKLILNSASGAGDTTYDGQPIRVNNAIISMRLIGQCLTWLIGQAQTFAGGKIASTNTDGLYSMLDIEGGFTEEVNNRVLKEQEQLIHVPIDPEKLLLVSKDSNNRLEMTVPENGELPKIVSASGGTLACYEEPRPDKSLAHPAITDWALARYLRYCAIGYEGLSVDTHLNLEVGKQLLQKARSMDDKILALRLFGHVIAASNSMFTFPFASDPIEIGQEDDEITGYRALQHYNRVFFVKRGTPGAVSLRTAGAWKVNAISQAKRMKNHEAATRTEPVALDICIANGYARTITDQYQGYTQLPTDQDVAVRKLSGIEPSWPAIVDNRDLYCLDEEELDTILESLDIDIYASMLQSTFNSNWSNVR